MEQRGSNPRTPHCERGALILRENYPDHSVIDPNSVFHLIAPVCEFLLAKPMSHEERKEFGGSSLKIHISQGLIERSCCKWRCVVDQRFHVETQRNCLAAQKMFPQLRRPTVIVPPPPEQPRVFLRS